jgi:LmbE family N-acetylglucosaminyl deacetylase
MTTAGDHRKAWRDVPVGDLSAVIGDGTCLILAPHPDDESLGCGGLIAACVADGRPPLVAILTDGAGSHPGSRAYPPERLRKIREQEARQAVAHLGLPSDRIIFLGEPDRAAPHNGAAFDAVVSRLLGLLDGNSAILAPWRYDPHCDHEAAALIAASVANTAGIRHVAYPVWGWLLPEATPMPDAPRRGCRLDIARYLAAKCQAIRAHRSQYSDLIDDDPTGFRLPEALLSVFDTPYETYLQS